MLPSNPIGAALLTSSSIKAPLRDCGYRPDLLRTNFSFGPARTVPLVAFAQSPADSRSACIAVLEETNTIHSAVEACRPLGAPVVFVCVQDALQWWKQGSGSAEYLESIPASALPQFFERNLRDFSPGAVYRAKTWGRFRPECQLSFVDVGLLPLVEEQVGQALGKLIERNVADLKSSVGWGELTEQQGHWLLQTVFWLVSGKILRDKQVAGFEDLKLTDVDDVFRRLAKHYGTEPLEIGSRKRVDGLHESARSIDQFSSLVLTTTESLAYVYENTLISKATRASFGTHRTPSYLVDYVVGNLTDWIEEIPINERSVFEPACGHAAFLVSAMRLLTELLPDDKAVPSRRGPYLRNRLHGTDIDSFALELARLSLTLTDIPNPNGWDLKVQDMFIGDHLRDQAKRNTILLANPPFGNFSAQEQQTHKDKESGTCYFNKSAEMLRRALPEMPEGGVFGVVLPQIFLHSAEATGIREFLVNQCELREVCLFPDKVFSFSAAESAVLIGRRKKTSGRNKARYRRIREGELDAFRADYSVRTSRDVQQSRFIPKESFSLRLPDLEEVWTALADYPMLSSVAAVGRGLTYHGKSLPVGSRTYAEERFAGSVKGFVHFNRGLKTHELPRHYWLNLNPSVIQDAREGATTGVPQVLLNYAPASRGPWRLKALVDTTGHAVTGRFITIRPTKPSYPLEALWAVLNSPVANAYVYSHLGKRDNLVGGIRKIPIPKRASTEGVEIAARAYLSAAASETDDKTLQKLLRDVDGEILKLYSLPIETERSLLALFTDRERVGVPFRQAGYLPGDLEGKIGFADFADLERDWSVTNRERGRLIDKSIAGTLSADEQTRLDALQAYADYHLDQVAPLPTHILDELEKRLGLPAHRKG
jgi:hypothetical protein